MTRTPSLLAANLSRLDRPEDRAGREDLIIEALADRSAPVREVAVAWAARCLEPARLVPLVAEEADSVLRNAALAALERQGPYAVGEVERMTAARDPDSAMFACQVLGGIGGPASSPPLLAALGRPEVNVVQAAAEALGKLRAPGAVPSLVALLAREPWLGLAAADALGAIGDPAAIPPLLALLPDGFLAEAALDALRRIGSPTVLPSLLPGLTDPAWLSLRPALVDAVSAALITAEPSEDLRALGAAIERDHSPESVWQLLSERLSESGDSLPAECAPERDDRAQRRGGSPAARAAGALVLAAGVSSLLPLVVRWAASRDGLAWIAPLAARYPARIDGSLERLLAHPDADVRTGALRVVEPVEIGLARLLPLLGDAEVSVRLAAIDALGALGDPRAIAPLFEILDGEATVEWAAVTRALGRMPAAPLQSALLPWLTTEGRDSRIVAALSVLAGIHLEGLEPRVLDLAGNGSGGGAVRRVALRAAASIPGSRAEVVLIRALADRDSALQVEALEMLVRRGGERVTTTLIALLGVADSLRYHVIRALGRIGDGRASEPLEALFPTAPLHEQLEILGALGRLRSRHCRQFLIDTLASGQDEIRHAAAQALVDLAEPEDLEVIRGLAADGDWVLRSEAARGFGRLGVAEGRPALLDLVRDLEPAVARTARAALAGRP